jgi:hypothetical protein
MQREERNGAQHTEQQAGGDPPFAPEKNKINIPQR